MFRGGEGPWNTYEFRYDFRVVLGRLSENRLILGLTKRKSTI